MGAVEGLKERMPLCVPMITLEGRVTDVLRGVRKNGDIDVLFESYNMAELWVELKHHRDGIRRLAGFDLERMDQYSIQDILWNHAPVVIPKSVWEWLRAPAL